MRQFAFGFILVFACISLYFTFKIFYDAKAVLAQVTPTPLSFPQAQGFALQGDVVPQPKPTATPTPKPTATPEYTPITAQNACDVAKSFEDASLYGRLNTTQKSLDYDNWALNALSHCHDEKIVIHLKGMLYSDIGQDEQELKYSTLYWRSDILRGQTLIKDCINYPAFHGTLNQGECLSQQMTNQWYLDNKS